MLNILGEALHWIGQILKYPCIIVLLVLMGAVLLSAGGFIIELSMERPKRKRTDIGTMINSISAGKNMSELIKGSQLTEYEKKSLMQLAESNLKEEVPLTALARQILAAEEKKYLKSIGITDMIATLGPMFGLLGTLIPLGPGIVALGTGDTSALSESLSIAFDTTIAGVISASIAWVISHMRRRWYEEYTLKFELLLECILERKKGDSGNRGEQHA